MRAVYSASKMYLNDEGNIDLIYLYLKEDLDNGYYLVFEYNNKKIEKMISNSIIFNKKNRKKIVNSIKFEEVKELINNLKVNLLSEEIKDFMEKLKGNY